MTQDDSFRIARAAAREKQNRFLSAAFAPHLEPADQGTRRKKNRRHPPEKNLALHRGSSSSSWIVFSGQGKSGTRWAKAWAEIAVVRPAISWARPMASGRS